MRGHAEQRRGVTLIELIVSTAVLGLLMGASTYALVQMRRAASMGNVQAEVQAMAHRALDRVVGDLRRSGFALEDAKFYPHVFTGGVPGEGFEAHAHATAVKHAHPDELDFGPDRSVVFLMPADVDGDGAPDLDAAGHLAWDEREFRYALVPGANGINSLVRSDSTGASVVVAHHLERVVFDDAVSSGFTVPLRSLRVRMFFRKADGHGLVHRYAVEATVEAHNGTEAGA